MCRCFLVCLSECYLNFCLKLASGLILILQLKEKMRGRRVRCVYILDLTNEFSFPFEYLAKGLQFCFSSLDRL